MPDKEFWIFLCIFFIVALIGKKINVKIRNTIILVVDILALVVFAIFLSLWEKILVLFGILVLSTSWIGFANRFNGLTKPLDLKKANVPGLLFSLGVLVIWLAIKFRLA